MKFRITGVDSSTGLDREVIIDSDNEETAVSLAKDQGIYVCKLQPAWEETAASQTDLSESIDHSVQVISKVKQDVVQWLSKKSMPRKENLVWGFGVGVPAILFLVFLTY